MLRIRLRRTGKKHQPHYRLVVAEHTAPLTGKFVALLGHYNPRTKELVIKDKEILEWIDKGAKPSNTVARLLTKQGLKHKQIVIHQYPERPSKKTLRKLPKPAKTVLLKRLLPTLPRQPNLMPKKAKITQKRKNRRNQLKKSQKINPKLKMKKNR